MGLRDARVLVTGGGTGIGRSTAALLSRAGARVAIAGRRADILERAAVEIGAMAVPTDVRRAGDVEYLFGRLDDEWSGLDMLVNNAGTSYVAPLVEQDAAEFRSVYETNVVGALLCGQQAAQRFLTQGSGTILNVAASAAQHGFPGGSAYVASKMALSGLTECWRDELGPRGIRVMQISPSEVQTGFGRRERGALDPRKLVAADVANVIVTMLSMEDRGLFSDAVLSATRSL